jgi:transketolase
MNISQAIGTASTASERDMANAIRFLAMDAVQAANSGHPGMPMGMADVATVLFNRFIRIDPSMPDWADRDRFRAVGRARFDADLRHPSSHRLCGHDDGSVAELPAMGDRKRPVIPSTATRSASRPPRDRWGRGSRPLSAWRWARK